MDLLLRLSPCPRNLEFGAGRVEKLAYTHAHTHTEIYTEWGLGYMHSQAGGQVLLRGQRDPGKTPPAPYEACTESSGWDEW